MCYAEIFVMGLIYKNNTDNQPIDYVYRTLKIIDIIAKSG